MAGNHISLHSAGPKEQNAERCQTLPVHKSRRIIIDLMHYQKELPMARLARELDLSELAESRRQASVSVSWPLLFLKAFALTAKEVPELRQTYMPGLWPRIYQHGTSIATLATMREVDGKEQLFFAKFFDPASETLLQLRSRLYHYQNDPVQALFGDHLRTESFPWPIRRLIWWTRMYFSGYKRVKRLGTFGLTTLAAYDITIQKAISPLPFILSYSPFRDGWKLTLALAFDHRLVDGMLVGRVLARIEEIMRTEMVDEMRSLAGEPAGDDH